ncbi:hypothetical protein E3N88_43453 [Mikania micrantha]|uniref:SH3 domain-containing protein n=1 Tax=Mikania micrantha TaxID=192012 RepID=A0A5N6LEW2_9ASTR|nr:hypothetical protein E3N88_43453 [Mikania micrantha]
MDALRKQASKLRDQVAKQQQAVIKQFSTSGYEHSDVMVIDELELQRHQQLEKLYRSTRSGKVTMHKLITLSMIFRHLFSCALFLLSKLGTKLSEDCCKYGVENVSDEILGKAASIYGDARKHVEKEQEDFTRLLFSQILEPLRAMINGAPLEDARHLAQRYSRMRQEAETQAAEVSRRQARVREAPIPENVTKLHAAEARMQELKANMAVLGKEASAALAAVESQQQRLTFQRLVAMVEGERTYHERVAAILHQIEAEMVSDKQRRESAPPAVPSNLMSDKTKYFWLRSCEAPPQKRFFSVSPRGAASVRFFNHDWYITGMKGLQCSWDGPAMHGFEASSDKELSLAIGDYVVVRKVSPSGWSEGECKGRNGWFPSAYVERRQRLPNTNGTPDFY